jgi:hypothetical protein
MQWVDFACYLHVKLTHYLESPGLPVTQVTAAPGVTANEGDRQRPTKTAASG